MSVTFIAEAGVNHNGDVEIAKRLIDVAAEVGADFVKFQSFVPSLLVSAGAPKATYQAASGNKSESQLAMLERLSLSRDEERSLAAHCARRGIAMLSTPFDLESLAFVAADLKLPMLKISSGSLTHGPMLLAAAKYGLPIILSTGMAEIAEVDEALDLLAWGMEHDGTPENRAAFQHARLREPGAAKLQARLTLLHCTSAYPAPLNEVNLRAMDTLSERFGLPVGYSDHTEGCTVALTAVGRGATVIEKHFTLDRRLPGPDHAASLEPDELKTLVAAIRDAAAALGSPEKSPTRTEASIARVARESLVTLHAVAKGEPFTSENLGVKRPGTGVSPMEYWQRLGSPARRSYRADELIEP